MKIRTFPRLITPLEQAENHTADLYNEVLYRNRWHAGYLLVDRVRFGGWN